MKGNYRSLNTFYFTGRIMRFARPRSSKQIKCEIYHLIISIGLQIKEISKAMGRGRTLDFNKIPNLLGRKS